MKKKIILVGVCLLLVWVTLITSSWTAGILGMFFYGIPLDWQTVEIDDYGTIRLPKEWKISTVDGFMYITSDEREESGYILIQSYDNMEMNTYFAGIEDKEFMRDINFSNSAAVTKYKIYYKNGTVGEMFCLDFYDAPDFYCVDNSISEKTLKKIAQSFEPCD